MLSVSQWPYECFLFRRKSLGAQRSLSLLALMFWGKETWNPGRKKQAEGTNSVSWGMMAVRREEFLTWVIHKPEGSEVRGSTQQRRAPHSVVGGLTAQKVPAHSPLPDSALLRAALSYMDLIQVE